MLGILFTVDLNCPSNFHGCHNDFSLAAEKLTIGAEILSHYPVELGFKASDISKLLKTVKANLYMSLFSSKVLLSARTSNIKTTKGSKVQPD